MRHHPHWLVRPGAQGPGHVAARHPDLVHGFEGRDQRHGELRQFPGPERDRVPPGIVRRADPVGQHRRVVGIEVDEVHRERIVSAVGHRKRALGVGERPNLDIDRLHRHARRLQRQHRTPRALTDAALRRQVAEHAHAPWSGEVDLRCCLRHAGGHLPVVDAPQRRSHPLPDVAGQQPEGRTRSHHAPPPQLPHHHHAPTPAA